MAEHSRHGGTGGPGPDGAGAVVFRLRLSPHREYESISPAIEALTGRAPKEFLEDPALLEDLVWPDDKFAIETLDYAKIQPGHTFSVRLNHRDGRQIWTEFILSPIRDGHETVAVEGVLRDISDSRRAEVTLQKLERMISDAFDGVAAIDMKTRRFLEMDLKATSLLAVQPREVAGTAPEDVFDEAACAHLDREGAMVAAGEIDRASFETTVRRHGHPDRHVFVRMSASGGDPPALLLIVEDRTARHRMLTERARLDTAVGSATDAIIIIDSSHSFLYSNRAFHKLTGYGAFECVGFRPEILRGVIPDEEPWASMTNAEPWKGLTRGHGKAGKPIQAIVSVSPIPESDGDAVSCVVVLHDVTQMQAAIEQLDTERASLDRLAHLMEELPEGASPEELGLAVCNAALILPGAVAALVLDLTVPEDAAVLAISPHAGFEQMARHLCAPARVEQLLAGRKPGPWTNEGLLRAARAEGSDFVRKDAQMLLMVPFPHGDGLAGLLIVLGTEETRDHVSSVEALAVSVGTLLTGGLVTRGGIRTIRREITDVLAHRRFRPRFQPIIDLADMGTVGWEATTRFDDEREPRERFAQAVSVGMATDLETATTRVAIAEAALNDTKGWLSLNVTPAFLSSGDKLLGLLPGPGEGRRVVLELSTLPVVDDHLRAIIDRLPAHVSLAVDSTTGEMHTLHGIVDLRPRFIKLPQTIVRGIHQDRIRQTLVAGLEYFARSTESDLVAVGVETEEELGALMKLKVGYAQGNYLGPPGFFPKAAGGPKP
jgi:PAS domain S-box-containing protein